MSTSDEDYIHSKLSYRNMAHSNNTVLVLMDATKSQIIQGVKAVNAVQAIDELVPPQINPLRGVTSKQTKVQSEYCISYNQSDYIHSKLFYRNMAHSNDTALVSGNKGS